ncbi:transglutaminase domain-containing protein [Polaribacter aquimarinus]|uniref:Transglutaminase-like domain-containing protein n=1 Tax=Polaribacter aquimarinus TaxID=2100726 RepID=A0A2U2J8P3_9FLAO|nr:DUF3857 domain-containing protein [Polaribacter aquimarinus]PWG04710.1 hypothetical protein DIS07_12275 [Polaribacter aquimarinus]
MKKILVITLLLSQISLIAQDYKFGKVSKEELKEKFYPLDSTADAAYLYKKEYVMFQYDGTLGWTVVKSVHERIKLYTLKDIEFATEKVSLYQNRGNKETLVGLKATTYNLEGSKIVKTKLKSKDVFKESLTESYILEKFTMPNLKKGSIIEWKYKKVSPFYYYIDDIEFQSTIPIKNLEVKVRIPEYFFFKNHYKGHLGKYFKKGKVGRSIKYSYREQSNKRRLKTTSYTETVDLNENTFEIREKDIQPLDDKEPFVYNINQYQAGAKFELSYVKFPNSPIKYYSTSWGKVSKQIFKSSLFGREIIKNKYYNNDLQNLLKSTNSDLEKVALIFNFVKFRMKWNGKYGKYTDKGVVKAYKEKVGNVADINLILISMLRSAGLNSNPVLVSSKGNGIPLFPTLDGFDYVISMVEFPSGGYVLLDATEPYSPPNILPARALNWNGRKVTKEGISSWVRLDAPSHALEENNLIVKVSEDLMLHGMIRTKYSNLNALNYRKRYNHVKDDNVLSKIEEDYNIEVDNFKVENKVNLGKPIVRSIKFSSENFVEGINGKLYIEPLLFLTQYNNPFKLKSRNFPVDFATPWKDRNIVSIQIPKGYKVEKLPESIFISLPNNLAAFKYDIIQKGSKINTVSTLQFNKAKIIPENYNNLKEFYSQLVKKQSEKIVLVKM